MAEQDNTFDRSEEDDEFGLPEVSYEPINRDAPAGSFENEHRYYADDEASDNQKKIWLTVGFIILFLGIIGAVVYFVAFHDAAPEPKEQLVSEIVSEPEPEPEPVEEVVVEETPEVTSTTYTDVTTISSATGRSYIVVGSFVDEDLARDFSEKLLQAEGIGSVIIEPFGKTSLLHRVAVTDYESFQEAMEQVENHRTTYGPETWVLKY
jgi:hypothetical protein